MSLITSPNLFSNPFRIMATITIFLNDVPREKGGEFIFTKPEDGNGEAVYISPTKGLAIVHHNTDEKYNFVSGVDPGDDQDFIDKQKEIESEIKKGYI